MKRIWILLLCVLLAGCGRNQVSQPGTFYYCRAEVALQTDDGVIAPELRDIGDCGGDLSAILALYLTGPSDPALSSPFPRDTVLERCEHDGDTVTVTLSREFATLKDLDLTLAAACVSRTVMCLTQEKTVVVQTVSAPMDTNVRVVMDESSVLWSDDSMEKLHATVTVYYTDKDRRYLIGQEISVNLASEDVYGDLFEQLATAPENSGLQSAIPKGTRLLSATLDNGVCTLNFSQQFISSGYTGTEAQRLTLLSIVNTMTQLEGVQKVEFSVGGDLLAQYRQLAITGPMTADESAIGPVRSNEFDATLYLSNGSQSSLVRVPCRLRSSASESQVELVLRALMEYSGLNGFYTTVPSQTELLSVTQVGTICRVHLSASFLSDSGHIPTSVRAIVCTLCAVSGVQSVQVTVEGYTTGDYDGYFALLNPDSPIFQ